MAFFSIIIPVYNVEQWLERCLESILADQCKDMEILLVDDGSTDSSGQICDQYAAAHPFIQVIHKENGGLSSARNAGLDHATGEWISFIDSDDWVDRDSYFSIRNLLAGLEGRKPDLVKFGYKKAKNGVNRVNIPCVAEGAYDRQGILQELLPTAFGSKRISDSTMHTFVLSSCAHIYRHDFLKESGVCFVSERLVGSEDFLFIYSLYIKASSVYVTHMAWYNYDTREGSLTQRYRKDLETQYKKLSELVYQELKKAELEKQLANDFKVFYIGLLYICVMNECAGAGSRTEQAARVRKLLKDQQLREFLKQLSFSDSKSRLIAGCMRLGAAWPLCMIQWKKSGGSR